MRNSASPGASSCTVFRCNLREMCGSTGHRVPCLKVAFLKTQSVFKTRGSSGSRLTDLYFDKHMLAYLLPPRPRAAGESVTASGVVASSLRPRLSFVRRVHTGRGFGDGLLRSPRPSPGRSISRGGEAWGLGDCPCPGQAALTSPSISGPPAPHTAVSKMHTDLPPSGPKMRHRSAAARLSVPVWWPRPCLIAWTHCGS